MNRTRRTAGAAALLLVPALLTGCGGGDGSSAGGEQEITVLAAASLTDSFTELAEQFESEHEGVSVKLAFDSSATLAEQANGGAPADVLATADEETMADAESALTEPATPFATNTMVVVTPAKNPAGIKEFGDLDKQGNTYVVCVPTAPCGDIAARLLDGTIDHEPASREVDVKAVLAKVTSNEADAGLVYETDAVAAGKDVTSVPIPGAPEAVTTYPIGTLTQSQDTELAREFVDLVKSETGQRVLEEAGFGPPPAQ